MCPDLQLEPLILVHVDVHPVKRLLIMSQSLHLLIGVVLKPVLLLLLLLLPACIPGRQPSKASV